MNTKVIQIFSQNFELHPSGALYWHEMEMLLIADVHFGKVTHFRKHGSAVPQAVIEQNFKQLNEVLHFFKPKVLTFLGDLFHSYINSEWKLFSEWVSQVDVNMNLISGNHDIIGPSKYEELDIHVTQEWKLGLFYLTHEPSVEKGFFNIAGHVHPGVKLQGEAKQYLTVPCFLQRSNQLILPAFGAFTGKYIVTPKEYDQIFVIADNEVIQILS